MTHWAVSNLVYRIEQVAGRRGGKYYRYIVNEVFNCTLIVTQVVFSIDSELVASLIAARSIMLNYTGLC